MRNLVRL